MGAFTSFGVKLGELSKDESKVQSKMRAEVIQACKGPGLDSPQLTSPNLGSNLDNPRLSLGQPRSKKNLCLVCYNSQGWSAKTIEEENFYSNPPS